MPSRVVDATGDGRPAHGGDGDNSSSAVGLVEFPVRVDTYGDTDPHLGVLQPELAEHRTTSSPGRTGPRPAVTATGQTGELVQARASRPLRGTSTRRRCDPADLSAFSISRSYIQTRDLSSDH
jgi:hypothetical protein